MGNRVPTISKPNQILLKSTLIPINSKFKDIDLLLKTKFKNTKMERLIIYHCFRCLCMLMWQTDLFLVIVGHLFQFDYICLLFVIVGYKFPLSSTSLSLWYIRTFILSPFNAFDLILDLSFTFNCWCINFHFLSIVKKTKFASNHLVLNQIATILWSLCIYMTCIIYN